MESEDSKSKGRFPLAVTLAIISVVGSIVVALITKWPFGPPAPKPIAVDTTVIQPRPNPDDLSFCDKLKLAIADVPLKFKNFKGPQTQETTYELVYQSNYVFDNIESGVIYEKPDKTYLLELQLYEGTDSIKAINIMNSYIAILDACLTTKNKQKLIESNHDLSHSNHDLGHLFFQDYLTEDAEVEIRTTLSDTSTVIIDVGKNNE